MIRAATILLRFGRKGFRQMIRTPKEARSKVNLLTGSKSSRLSKIFVPILFLHQELTKCPCLKCRIHFLVWQTQVESGNWVAEQTQTSQGIVHKTSLTRDVISYQELSRIHNDWPEIVTSLLKFWVLVLNCKFPNVFFVFLFLFFFFWGGGGVALLVIFLSFPRWILQKFQSIISDGVWILNTKKVGFAQTVYFPMFANFCLIPLTKTWSNRFPWKTSSV